MDGLSQKTVDLLDACKERSTSLVEEMLRLVDDVNAADREGYTPLHYACSRNDQSCTEIVKVLLAKGAEIERQSCIGTTALHHALSDNASPELFSLLLEHGAKVTTVSFGGRTAAHHVIGRTNTESRIVIIDMLKDMGVSIHATDDSGESPLHLALFYGNTKLAYRLVQLGGDCNTATDDGKTLIHMLACDLQDSPSAIRIVNDFLALLVQKGAKVDSVDKHNSTPIHIACANNRFHVVKALLDCGASVDPLDDRGETPLHKAVQSPGDPTKIILLLLERGADPFISDQGDSVLHKLCARSPSTHFPEEVSVFQRLMASSTRNVNIHALNSSGQTALQVAIDMGALDLGMALIRNGADCNTTGSSLGTLLHLVARRARHFHAEELLNNFNADLSIQDHNGWTPLHCACSFQDAEPTQLTQHFIAFLLERHADVNTRTTERTGDWDRWLTPLHMLVLGISQVEEQRIIHILSVIREILSNENTNVNAQLEAGSTPLHLACTSDMQGHCREAVQLLLGHNRMDASIRDAEGYTALHRACMNFQTDAIGEIIRNNPQALEDGDPDGKTALHICTELGIVAQTRYLLENGANVDARATSGSTALHLACSSNNLRMVQVILHHRPNPTLSASDGWTPLHEACRHNRHELVQLLLQQTTHPFSPRDLKSSWKLAAEWNSFQVAWLILRKYPWLALEE